MKQEISSVNEPVPENMATAVNSHIYSSLFASDHRDFLLSPTGAQIKISELKNKIIGIYFSANWYPPCQSFTKLLIEVYGQIRAKNGPNFEIIFVSSDEDLNAFNDYYQSCMPWLAVPFSDLDTKRALNRKFDVEGIPCLVILQPDDHDRNKDETGNLHDGVELIYRYGAEAYPFTNERLGELSKQEKERHERQTLTSLLMNHDRDFVLAHVASKQVPVSSLMGKTIGLYFSAQWCLPSEKFNPKLISIYQKIKQKLNQQKIDEQEDFEIVYIPSDRNESEFKSSFDTMPWLALPFGDKTINDLTKYFDIRGIPSLVILGPDGKTVTKHGRSLINLYGEEAYPFTETQVDRLEKHMDQIARQLPVRELHSGHRHELTLVSQGNGGGPFICCDCDEQGSGWAYQCINCGYEVHIKCVRPVDQASHA